MKKIILIITFFMMMPIMGEQYSFWKKYTPAFVASFKQAVMRPFVSVKSAANNNPFSFSKMSEFIKQRNTFIAGLSKYPSIVKAESKSDEGISQKVFWKNVLVNAIKHHDFYLAKIALENDAAISSETQSQLLKKFYACKMAGIRQRESSECDAVEKINEKLL